MCRELFHRLIAVICLLTTGFHALAGGLVVECRESNGVSHLEWGGCGRDESDRCVRPCGPQRSDDFESGTPSPCEDKPVKSNVVTATVRSAPSSITVDLPLPIFAVIAFLFDRPPLNMLVRWIDVRAAAPPPALMFLRTIVMLV
ncbi:MAG: hypothetical protein KF805_15515 [Phycisphaeraceae bacterium]|nr:hypothetical protein [Phycisphaeraceae bacterium]